MDVSADVAKLLNSMSCLPKYSRMARRCQPGYKSCRELSTALVPPEMWMWEWHLGHPWPSELSCSSQALRHHHGVAPTQAHAEIIPPGTLYRHLEPF